MLTVESVKLELERLKNEVSKVETHEKVYDTWHKKNRYDAKNYTKIQSDLKEMKILGINDVISFSRAELKFVPREAYVLAVSTVCGKTLIDVFYDLVEKKLYVLE